MHLEDLVYRFHRCRRAWHAGKETLGTREICYLLLGHSSHEGMRSTSESKMEVHTKVLLLNDNKDSNEKAKQKSELSI